MNKEENEFSSALQTIIKSIVKGSICFEGIIQGVNSDYTCEVKVGSTVYHNVPISVLKKSKASLYLKPKANTSCLLTFKDGNIQRPTIMKIHEADQILIDAPETVFNGGSDGMVKLKETTDNFNSLKDYVEALKMSIQTSLTALDAVIPTSSVFNTSMAMKAINIKDMENPKVKM